MLENSYWEHFFQNDQMAFVYLDFNCKDSADVVLPVYKKNSYIFQYQFERSTMK